MININDIKNNFLSGFVVFLVAIPLCLGIALASNVSLFAGVVTGIIGGIIVGFISQSHISVSGPAAGMVAVVLSAVSQLGTFETFLLALFFAGIFQVIIGLFKVGFIANFVPTIVIQGLLAAIGILIIVKQLPLAFGYTSNSTNFAQSLEMAQETLSLAPIINLIHHINLVASVITIAALFILIAWEKILPRLATILPAAIVAVIVSVGINFIFSLVSPNLALQTTHLVNIPVNESFMSFIAQFKHPDFAQWHNTSVYIYAAMIAIVASLETLLNLQAAERIDTKRRYCSRSRELVAQGVGNMISGLIGGLPVTSVIVRSSVNINAGATSKLSTILHGVLLLLSISFIGKWLNYIPIAALAAVLIHTGYKLTKVSLFKQAYVQGWSYFICFMLTIIAIVLTNLLLGILIGLFFSIFVMLKYNSKYCFTIVNEKRPSGETIRLLLPQQVTFINKPAILEKLNQIPGNTKIVIDANATDYIDHDILDVIKEFKAIQAPEKNILLNLEGFQEHYDISNQRNFISATTFDVQANLTPVMILDILREGNFRFQNNTPIHKDYHHHIDATAKKQHPIAVILGCIDSRVPIEIIFDLNLGDILAIRVAGNIASEDILGNLEFACKIAGAKLIVILAHKQCGTIKAACDGVHFGHISQLVEKINPAIQLEVETKMNRNGDNEKFLMNVTRNNIKITKDFIYQNSPILRELIDSKTVGLIDSIYDVETGIVSFNDADFSHNGYHRDKEISSTAVSS